MPGSSRKALTFFVSTALAGLLLLVPLALLGVVFYFAYDLVVELAQVTGLDLPFSDFVDGIIIGLGALLGVIATCFLIGLLLRTGIGAALETRYDHLLEKYLPVVGMLRNLVMQIVGSNEEVLKLRPAEVALFGSASRQYALIVEELPDGRVVGLSKLARVVEGVARRPQVQERMTEEIANLLVDELHAKGVAVVIEAVHTCMTVRGIRKPGSTCVTSAMKGCFRTRGATRAELMTLIYGDRR